MKTRYILLLIIILVSACETVVDVDIPLEAPKLVANAFINPDSVIAIQVSKSKHVLDMSSLKLVDDASVNIYENGSLKETVTQPIDEFYQSTFRPAEGNDYTIEIEAPGATSIQANTLIIPKPQVEALEYQIENVEQYSYCDVDTCYTDYQNKYVVDLTLMDESGERNYYEIIAFRYYEQYEYEYTDKGEYLITDTVMRKERVYLESTDPVLSGSDFMVDGSTYYGDQLVFSDELFDGKSYTLNFMMDSYNYYYDGISDSDNPEQIQLQINSIDQSTYLYRRTLDIQYENEYNPFAEPINVYSNFENGYGVLGSYNGSVYTIESE